MIGLSAAITPFLFATDLVLVTLDSLGPQLTVNQTSSSWVEMYHFHTIYKRPHSIALSQLSFALPLVIKTYTRHHTNEVKMSAIG